MAIHPTLIHIRQSGLKWRSSYWTIHRTLWNKQEMNQKLGAPGQFLNLEFVFVKSSDALIFCSRQPGAQDGQDVLFYLWSYLFRQCVPPKINHCFSYWGKKNKTIPCFPVVISVHSLCISSTDCDELALCLPGTDPVALYRRLVFSLAHSPDSLRK